jgi:hypothetical protein
MIFSHVGAIVRKQLKPLQERTQNAKLEQRPTREARRDAVTNKQAADATAYRLVLLVVAIMLLLLILWLLANWQSGS